METQNKITTTGFGTLKNISGVWKLIYTPMNTLGAEVFGGLTITTYKNPRTAKAIPRRDPNGVALPYLMIGGIETPFNPNINPQERLDIEWMLHHPQVDIEGYDDLPEEYKRAKNDNNQLKLVSLDYQEYHEIEETDYIDKLVGRLSIEGGPQALGLDKIRYILAELNKRYREEKYRTNRALEKKYLKSKLKAFIKSDYENAKEVNDVLEILDQAKITYQIKEMIRLGIIVEKNGMFKHEHIPLGVSVLGILKAWEQEPELKMTMIKQLPK